MFQSEVADKTKHISCAQKNFNKNFTVYEIMWKNIVEPKRPQMTIIRHRKRVICMPGNRGKNTDTH